MPQAQLPGNPDTVVLVPMYNEAEVVGSVITELLTCFSNVVVIDDGSTDDSAEIARACGVRVIQHSVNLGQGAALATGLEYALTATGASFVVTFDADAQHDVGDALTMIGILRSTGVQVVLGSRFLSPTGDLPPGRRALLRAAVAWTRRTTGLNVTDAHNGLRAFTRKAAAYMVLRQRGMAHSSELLHLIANSRLDYTECPVTVAYTDYSRAKGQRGINAVNILFDLALAKLHPAS